MNLNLQMLLATPLTAFIPPDAVQPQCYNQGPQAIEPHLGQMREPRQKGRLNTCHFFVCYMLLLLHVG